MKVSSGEQAKRAATQRRLDLIRNYLRALNIKDNKELLVCVRELENSGKQQLLMWTIRESMAASSSCAQVSQFIYLLDYMVGLPALGAVLQRYLTELYCDLFKHLFCQQNYAALQELKVIRKYWLGKVPPAFFAHTQQVVINHFQDDLERIPQQAANDLKKFYIERLRMSYHDVYLHLPQLKTPTPITYSLDNPNNQLERSLPQKPQSTQNTDASFSSESTFDNVAEEQIALSRKDIISLKRMRLESEETTVSLKPTKKFKSNATQSLEDKSRAKTHSEASTKAQIKAKGKTVSNEYNFLICYVCHKCHLKFELEEDLHAHSLTHRKVGQPTQELPKSQPSHQDQRRVFVKPEECCNYTRTCRVCDNEMEVRYKNGGWVFLNCIKLNIYDVDIIIHGDCRSQMVVAPDEPSAEDPSSPQA